MKYCSTRGGASNLTFVDSLLTGLAPDGGLLVPETVPDVAAQLDAWRELAFVPFAQEVIAVFVDDIERATLDRLITDAYATFDCDDVLGWQRLGDITLIELFHGPTLAFKDVALQLLGRLFEHVLTTRHQRLNILGATSGDTGSAAIAGVRGQSNIDIFILYPDNKVSRLQELQMTTVPDANVHCIAVEGSFDDCQSLMKEVFADLDFKKQFSLGAVNSVNWARIMAQIVYYGYVSLKFDRPPAFCVPTGNFGNIFAGYFAREMGFPIDQLLIATNENDILSRYFNEGRYARGDVHHTLSPAMDIQVASNFERYLYFLMDRDTQKLRDFMDEFQSRQMAQSPPADAGRDFRATAVNKAQTLAAIAEVHQQYDYVLDPHTAVGYAAAKTFADSVDAPIAVMATAHPAKFPDAVAQALNGYSVTHPTLTRLVGLPERKHKIAATVAAVKQEISNALT